jgi:hypothetical protein
MTGLLDPDHNPEHRAALQRYAQALEAVKVVCDTFGCSSCDTDSEDPWFVCECPCHDDEPDWP